MSTCEKPNTSRPQGIYIYLAFDRLLYYSEKKYFDKIFFVKISNEEVLRALNRFLVVVEEDVIDLCWTRRGYI